MSNELIAAVDRLWREGNTDLAALREGQLSTSKLRSELGAVLARVQARVLVGKSNIDPATAPKNVSAETGRDLNADEYSRFLLLISLGINHSDSLVYLPPEMRQERLNAWTQLTKFDVDLVKEAVTLGPSGLLKILERS